MSFKIVNLLISVFLVFLLLFLLAPQTQGAFGISPPFLNANYLIKGARYSQIIYLVQDQPNEDLKIKAVLDISEKIRSWIKIDKGFEFVIPKGTRQFPVEVIIEVPKDAGLGIYRGNLSFTGAPAQSGQVTIAMGVQVALNLTVGEGIYQKLSVPMIRLLDIEESWAPRVYIKVSNEGNVSEVFTGATYELMDQFGETRLAYMQKTKDFPEIPPFTQGEYTIEFPINFHLGIGQYWGNVVFYQNEKAVASQKTVFNVLKAGSISGSVAQFSGFMKTNKNYLFITLIIIVFAIGFGIWRKNRRAKKASL
ncbi:MAG: hypothetical protein QMD65_02275 [Patescibacteria group bacterium]|nr:hypothetical protein [Patescibacteria group bacterium]